MNELDDNVGRLADIGGLWARILKDDDDHEGVHLTRVHLTCVKMRSSDRCSSDTCSSADCRYLSASMIDIATVFVQFVHVEGL